MQISDILIHLKFPGLTQVDQTSCNNIITNLNDAPYVPPRCLFKFSVLLQLSNLDRL